MLWINDAPWILKSMTTFNTDYLIMLVQKVIWWSYSFQLKARQLESTVRKQSWNEILGEGHLILDPWFSFNCYFLGKWHPNLNLHGIVWQNNFGWADPGIVLVNWYIYFLDPFIEYRFFIQPSSNLPRTSLHLWSSIDAQCIQMLWRCRFFSLFYSDPLGLWVSEASIGSLMNSASHT